jgi:hypothetical protein
MEPMTRTFHNYCPFLIMLLHEVIMYDFNHDCVTLILCDDDFMTTWLVVIFKDVYLR